MIVLHWKNGILHQTYVRVVSLLTRPHFFFIFALGAFMVLAPSTLLADRDHYRDLQIADLNRSGKTIKIEGAFARASAGSAKNGVTYLTIHNTSEQPDHLEGAKTSVARRAEIHSHKHDKGVMRMRPILSIEIPAKAMTVLKPGGDHLMLIGLKAPLENGDEFLLTLIFKNAGEVPVTVEIREVGARMQQRSGGSGHRGHKH